MLHFNPFLPILTALGLQLDTGNHSVRPTTDSTRTVSSGAPAAGSKGAHAHLFSSMSTYTSVFGELVLTQTQPCYCPPPSAVRMFEGRLIAQLALISAGSKHPAAGRPRPPRALEARGDKAGIIAGKVTFKTVDRFNYRFLLSCFKIEGSKTTRGIPLNPPSNPPIK